MCVVVVVVFVLFKLCSCIECSPTAALLHGDDAFVVRVFPSSQRAGELTRAQVHDTKTLFVWKGSHVSEFAFDTATKIAKKLHNHVSAVWFFFCGLCFLSHSLAQGKIITVNEDLEPPTFWKILGGKKAHASHQQVAAGKGVFERVH